MTASTDPEAAVGELWNSSVFPAADGCWVLAVVLDAGKEEATILRGE
jgi:hypothetical protein